MHQKKQNRNRIAAASSIPAAADDDHVIYRRVKRKLIQTIRELRAISPMASRYLAIHLYFDNRNQRIYYTGIDLTTLPLGNHS